MSILTKFFLACSGANQTILKECPTERNKYVGIGATIFFTGTFAFISGAYALYMVFESVLGSLLFGLAWGSMVFNLDRYIVSSMKKMGNFWKEFQLALPRLFLAILLAIVISKPLELKIFEPEIEAELVLMGQDLLKEQEDKVKNRFTPQIESLQTEVDKLKAEIKTQSTKRDELVLAAQREADGTGGSGRASLGPIYRIKKKAAEAAEAELTKVLDANQPIIEMKLKEISMFNSQMLLALKSMEKQRFNGLAARLKALSQISEKSQAIMLANWFIVLLFLSIETSPLFVKLISSKGPYDDLLKVHEHTFSVYHIQQIAKLDHQTHEKMKTFTEGKADNDSLRIISKS